MSIRTVLAVAGMTSLAAAQPAPTPPARPPMTYPALPTEIPAKFTPVTDAFGYDRREAMIAMRDGVKLYTVILVPRGARRAPILLTRTPYDASEMTGHARSAHLGPLLQGYDNMTDVIVDGGYIRVVQDVRGKYKSEGDYVMNRPLHGPQNPTPVDHATDTYDTIEWLVHNVAESNGNVGILGISYDGFLPLMALVHPHPALKVSVPMNPMVDGWMGDDWFHHGAFRQIGIDYIHDQEATRDNSTKWWRDRFDDYETFLAAGSAGELGKRHGMDQIGFWSKIAAHPAYDAYWRDQAVDQVLAKEPLAVPVMLVHSLWDQEDIYGAIAVYRAIKPKDTANDKVFLVLGPWHHGQELGDGSALGAIKFGSDTALAFRRDVLRPFLDHYLKDGAPPADVAPVTAFQTGTNAWRRLPAWPVPAARPTPLYLHAAPAPGRGPAASFAAPRAGETFEEYVADPAKPVPFVPRPIPPSSFDGNAHWRPWLVSDQRDVASRPDVVSFTSDVLTAPVHIAGQPQVRLIAATTGSDADWVVKLIDVYPDEVAHDPAMGGYQLMIAADIFRGRYREGYEVGRPIAPGKPLAYQWALPTANHVFLPGHRILVQIQSSWFPLYDRNPQTFVPNIFWAKPADFRAATQRIYHAPDQASAITLPVVPAP
jgi:uncharacterized protein